MDAKQLNDLAFAWVNQQKEKHGSDAWYKYPTLRFAEWRSFMTTIELTKQDISWLVSNAKLLTYLQGHVMRNLLHTLYVFDLQWKMEDIELLTRPETKTQTDVYSSGTMVLLDDKNQILHKYTDFGDGKKISTQKASITDWLKRVGMAMGAGSKIYNFADVVISVPDKSSYQSLSIEYLEVLEKFAEKALANDSKFLKPNKFWSIDALAKALGVKIKTADQTTSATPPTSTAKPTQALPSADRQEIAPKKLSINELIGTSKESFQKIAEAQHKITSVAQITQAIQRVKNGQAVVVKSDSVHYIVALAKENNTLVKFLMDEISYQEVASTLDHKVMNL